MTTKKESLSDEQLEQVSGGKTSAGSNLSTQKAYSVGTLNKALLGEEPDPSNNFTDPVVDRRR